MHKKCTVTKVSELNRNKEIEVLDRRIHTIYFCFFQFHFDYHTINVNISVVVFILL